MSTLVTLPRRCSRLALWGSLLAGALLSVRLEAADLPQRFFAKHCLDCHEGPAAANGIDLAEAQTWSASDLLSHQESAELQRVLRAIRDGLMPPQDAEQPTASQRAAAAEKIEQALMQKSPIGGTLLRRLSRREYEGSIRKIFGFDYQLPNSFPEDRVDRGFDNSAEGLLLSAPLMEAYFHAAIEIADLLLPPPAKPVEPTQTRIPADDLVISYSSGAVLDGAMRLAFDWDVMFRSTTWPEKWEAKHAGTYKIRVAASQFLSRNQAYPSFTEPMTLEVRARSLDTPDSGRVHEQRLLAGFDVAREQAEDFELVCELYPHETPIFYFANGPVPGEKEPLEQLTLDMFQRDNRLYAAWLSRPQTNGGRGGLGWERVKQVRDSDDLDMSSVDTSPEALAKLAKSLSSNPANFGETMVFQFYEEGPALELHDVTIEGPLELLSSPEELSRKVRLEEMLGAQGSLTDEQYLKAFYARYLPELFRRPATDEELTYYVALSLAEWRQTGSFRKAIHLGIRTSLMSPHFLYRGHRPGKLDAYDLASRLSYFLTNQPPDARLSAAAADGSLSDLHVLSAQAQRLLDSPLSYNFVSSFVGGWLEIDQLEDIMPDALLIADFSDEDRQAMIDECEMFFAEILSKNLPLATFIQPGFTFLNAGLAKKIYGITGVQQSHMQRVELPSDSPYGGLLGQAATMMVTANGVDTLPVTRGVWVLQNILGDEPPEPPTNVPALTPDTSQAKTVRELLEAHRADDACASCHRSIDPIGFVLENFDPVGRWRSHYPLHTENAKSKPIVQDGARIDASGTYKDGTHFQDVHDLKAYIVANIDQFSNCLAQTLLEYGTGRPVSYAEKIELQTALHALSHGGQQVGFRDLLLAVIRSESFRTK